MTVTIQNLTPRRVLLRFNSGRTQHLAPQGTVQDIEATEIKSNSKIKKLLENHAISIMRAQEGTGAKPSQKQKSSPKKSETK